MNLNPLLQHISYLESLLKKNNIPFLAYPLPDLLMSTDLGSPPSNLGSPPPTLGSLPPTLESPTQSPVSLSPTPLESIGLQLASPPSHLTLSTIPPPLTSSLLLRYSRQMLLPEISLAGQLLLSSSKVLIVGVGGLGAPLLLYLVGAGISVGVSDFDKVDVSNLHRQIIYGGREGKDKREEAKKRAKELNPEVEVWEEERIGKENAEEIVERYDYVVDASDNAESRYLLNDVCYLSYYAK
jgi:hypothetical protein